jgi:hypothetical protein
MLAAGGGGNFVADKPRPYISQAVNLLQLVTGCNIPAILTALQVYIFYSTLPKAFETKFRAFGVREPEARTHSSATTIMQSSSINSTMTDFLGFRTTP